MATSALSRLLDLIEESRGLLSIPDLARELGVTQSRVENMLEYWIQKGKIQASNTLTDCGGCGALHNCPFVLGMPRTFELIQEMGEESGGIIVPICEK